MRASSGSHFTTYSVVRLTRLQAATLGWVRPKVKFVRWGAAKPPAGDNKLVDVCPLHSAAVMTGDELKAKRIADKAARAAKRAAKKAGKNV